ncbi:MAG: IS30 family transposase [Jiangellaceae bacterium]
MAGRSLSMDERMEIDRWWHARNWGVGVESMRSLAARLGRSPSVISREVRRNSSGQLGYHAAWAQKKADRRRRRPKQPRLATAGLLRTLVIAGLRAHHSPQQIAGRLRRLFPDRPEMWVSHETIYQAIYLQARGGLKRELQRALRSGRTRRRPQRPATPRRQSRRSWAVPRIAERPPEVADRAVPGHWEGDLLMGTANTSAIAVLVERTSRFTLLAALPNGWTTEAVTAAITTKITDLPARLRRTLTWDCGNEMAGHPQLSIAADLDCYFCDPHHPWQKGTVENTNGLLREYFPKGKFDFRSCSQAYLDAVADELNNRPRAILNYATPREKLNEVVVASTG